MYIMRGAAYYMCLCVWIVYAYILNDRRGSRFSGIDMQGAGERERESERDGVGQPDR